MGYPDHFSIRAYDAAQGRHDAPIHTVTDALPGDVTALANVIAAHDAFLAALRANPWACDCVSHISNADHIREEEAVGKALRAAKREVELRLLGAFD